MITANSAATPGDELLKILEDNTIFQQVLKSLPLEQQQQVLEEAIRLATELRTVLTRTPKG